MRNSNITYALITLLCIFGNENIIFAQNVSTITTQYSSLNNGIIGKENYSFSISNGTITITDIDYRRSEKYGSLKYGTNGFDENGFYYDSYVSDISKDPEAWINGEKKPRTYKFFYDKKNGSILIITEVKIDESGKPKAKIFYTSQGHLLIDALKKKNNQRLNARSFDLANILLNATSLSQIASKIESVFVKYGERKIDPDKSSYSFNYKNSSDMKIIITYKTSNDEITRLFFLMPIADAVEIRNKSFMNNTKLKQVDEENTIWVNSSDGLVYVVGKDGETGVIVVNKE